MNEAFMFDLEKALSDWRKSLAADPSLEPLRSWSFKQDLWRFILADGESRPGWAYGVNSQQWDPARQDFGIKDIIPRD